MKQKDLAPQQLGFDFDADFNNILNTATKLQEINDDRRPTTTASDSGKGSEYPDIAIDSQSTIQSVRMDNSGQMGNEFTASSNGLGEQGGSSDIQSTSGSTENGTENNLTEHAADQRGDDENRNIATTSSPARFVEPNNYKITDSDNLGIGGAKAKYQDNIAAITTLKNIEAESRNATLDEQAILIKYVGWGGLPQAFDHRNDNWANEFKELSSILAIEEYEAARRSTQDAHYTPALVVSNIYAGLERLGFTGGNILDPAVGSGHFIGLLPDSINQNSKVTGIELDPLTARIASTLYPESSIINKGFQEVVIPKNRFDVVIGNFPFGSQTVYDEDYPELAKFSIHNYFTAKSIDNIRPGGLMAMVVSNYFMDGIDDKARAYVADRAHLLGAIRLPNNTFKQNALTEVTTDIIFFQKAFESQETDKSWLDTEPQFDTQTNTRYNLNKYYIDRPEMMLGTMKMVNMSFRGGNSALIADENQDLENALITAIGKLPEGIYQKPSIFNESDITDDKVEVPDDVKVGGYFVVSAINGQALDKERIARRLPDLLADKSYEWAELKNELVGERIKGMIGIKTALRTLMDYEKSEYSSGIELDAYRNHLNSVYDKFVKKHGYISSLLMKQAMGDDPEFPLLMALERDYDKGISKDSAKKHGVEPREASAKKAAIFTKRVLSPLREITKVDTAKEALIVSMNELGRVDLSRMVRLTGKAEDVILDELKGFIYLNPINNKYETAEHYLSGNVKEKLQQAWEATFRNAIYEENVAALELVQPQDIEPVDISIQLGSSWVPDAIVSDFIGHLIGDVKRDISYQKAIGKWIVKISAPDETTNNVTWGTEDLGANTLIEKILTNKSIEVKDVVGYDDYRNPIYRLNEGKTAAATQKADEIKQAFEDWIWEDKERRTSLARLYNDQFNTNVATKYDGSHLTLPGASLSVQLRPHQKNAIWRGIQDGTALFDHVVGAGKTYEFIATGIESKRMGLMKKPMFVVPNHLLLQWKDAFYELYPSANILIAEKSDFSKENRQRLFGRIATGDWDAVIVAHSSFKKIGVPNETLKIILDEQIDDLTMAISELKGNNGQHFSIKELEKTRDRMESRLARAADTGSKDAVVSFADLGVDAIFLDESQQFKNLYITTSMNRVAGLGNLEGSEKAFDLFIKARYLQMKHDGRGLFFGTGTPISNTIAELYTVQRYMQYDEMKRRGIVHFDAWASTFGKVVTGWELDATGVNYRLNSRFAKFQNVPELTALYRSFADVITRSDLERQGLEIGKPFPTPKVKGGKPENIIVPRSQDQALFMGVQSPVLDEDGMPVTRADGTIVKKWTAGSIIDRMENLPDDPSIDNPLKITNEARKAGLDYRLIDPDAEDHEGSKLNELVHRAHNIYARWDARKGTQLIFCDLSTPKASSQKTAFVVPEIISATGDEIEEVDTVSMDELLSANSKFSVYEDIRDKLVARGVPPHQIRFIHDAKTDLQKSKLFDEMNRGVVRILLGSTEKMGAGTNVQRKLVAEHHLDAPWRPSDLEQREGRIIRQGNEFYEEDPEGFEVELLRYATEKTYDGRMWQTIEVKAAGIEQFRKGDALQRVIEDISSEAANAAEMKAAATGNPLIFMQVKLNADLKKLEAVYSSYKRAHHTLDSRIDWLSNAEQRSSAILQKLNAEIARRDAQSSEHFSYELGGKKYGEKTKKELLPEIMAVMKLALQNKAKDGEKNPETFSVGKFRGFDIAVYGERDSLQFVIKGEDLYSPRNLEYHKEDEFSLNGFINRLNNYVNSFEEKIQANQTKLVTDLEELDKAMIEKSKPFTQLKKLETLRLDCGDVLSELKKVQNDDNYISTWKPRSQDVSDEPQKAVADQHIEVPVEQMIFDDLVGQDRSRILANTNGRDVMPVDTQFGYYRGTILEKTDYHVVQNIGKRYIVLHDINILDNHPPVGDLMEVRYKNNQANIIKQDIKNELKQNAR